MQGPVSTWLGDRQGNSRNRRLLVRPLFPTTFRCIAQQHSDVYWVTTFRCSLHCSIPMFIFLTFRCLFSNIPISLFLIYTPVSSWAFNIPMSLYQTLRVDTSRTADGATFWPLWFPCLGNRKDDMTFRFLVSVDALKFLRIPQQIVRQSLLSCLQNLETFQSSFSHASIRRVT